MVRETNEKIAMVREKMKVAQDRHKSYADQHRKDKEFSVGEHILLKISPIWGVLRFGQKGGKLSPNYITRFEILECMGKVTYQLTILPKLSRIHYIFYVSILREYHQGSTPYMIDFNDIEVNSNMFYIERSA